MDLERKNHLTSRYQTALFNTPVQGIMALAISSPATKRRHNSEMRIAHTLKSNGPAKPGR